jgi:putative IMPACT (imprinted ancient) family translation regulator
MLTLEHTTSLEQIIKKSRFVATAGPIASEQAAKDFIAAHSDGGANTAIKPLSYSYCPHLRG